jgi:natural product precursor
MIMKKLGTLKLNNIEGISVDEQKALKGGGGVGYQ